MLQISWERIYNLFTAANPVLCSGEKKNDTSQSKKFQPERLTNSQVPVLVETGEVKGKRRRRRKGSREGNSSRWVETRFALKFRPRRKEAIFRGPRWR